MAPRGQMAPRGAWQRALGAPLPGAWNVSSASLG
jgi:hypothetical protein